MKKPLSSRQWHALNVITRHKRRQATMRRGARALGDPVPVEPSARAERLRWLQAALALLRTCRDSPDASPAAKRHHQRRIGQYLAKIRLFKGKPMTRIQLRPPKKLYVVVPRVATPGQQPLAVFTARSKAVEAMPELRDLHGFSVVLAIYDWAEDNWDQVAPMRKTPQVRA